MGRCCGPRSAMCLVFLLSLFGLAGCSNDSSGEVGFNPGENQPVSLLLEDFKTDDLRWSAYPGFFKAIEPNEPDAEEAREIIRDMANAAAPFLKFQPEVQEISPVQFDSSHNAVDLMNWVIYNDLVKNFEDGRAVISSAIDRGEPARYQNDRIQFVQEREEETLVWSYILAWIHIAEAEGDDPTAEATEELVGRTISNAVVRVILAVNSPGSEITVFPAATFRANGPQVTPEARITSFSLPLAADTPASANEAVPPATTLNQSWTGREDLWTWTSEVARSFGDYDEVRCAHLRADYASGQAYFYTSSTPSRVGLEDTTDPDNLPVEGEADTPKCGAIYPTSTAPGNAKAVWQLVPENEELRN